MKNKLRIKMTKDMKSLGCDVIVVRDKDGNLSSTDFHFKFELKNVYPLPSTIMRNNIRHTGKL